MEWKSAVIPDWMGPMPEPCSQWKIEQECGPIYDERGKDTTAPRYGHTGNGRTGLKQSEETKRKISEALKGNPKLRRKRTPEERARMSAAAKGKKHTPEAIEKMRKAKKGKKFSEAHKQAMRDAWAVTEHRYRRTGEPAKGRRKKND